MNCLLLITLLLIAAVSGQEQPLTPWQRVVSVFSAKHDIPAKKTSVLDAAKATVPDATKKLSVGAQAGPKKFNALDTAFSAGKPTMLSAGPPLGPGTKAAKNANEVRKVAGTAADKLGKQAVKEADEAAKIGAQNADKAAKIGAQNADKAAIIGAQNAHEAAKLAAMNADVAAGAAKGLGKTKIGLLVGGAGIATVAGVAAIKHLLDGNKRQDALRATVVERRFRH